MAHDTIWDTAHSLLASLNAYKKENPKALIGSADTKVPEPTLIWVASEEGMVLQTWSIPLRLFRSTINSVKAESYQGGASRLDMERRILALTKDPGVTKPMPSNMDLPVLATLDVIGYSESRRVDPVKEPGSDRVLYLAPVSGTQQAFIDVRTSKGQIFRIPIDEYIYSVLCGDTEHVQG